MGGTRTWRKPVLESHRDWFREREREAAAKMGWTDGDYQRIGPISGADTNSFGVSAGTGWTGSVQPGGIYRLAAVSASGAASLYPPGNPANAISLASGYYMAARGRLVSAPIVTGNQGGWLGPYVATDTDVAVGFRHDKSATHFIGGRINGTAGLAPVASTVALDNNWHDFECYYDPDDDATEFHFRVDGEDWLTATITDNSANNGYLQWMAARPYSSSSFTLEISHAIGFRAVPS